MHHISHLFASRKPFIVPFILSLLVYGGALFILSPHITHAAGNTYYVATTGSDSNSGTISSPFRTIAKGLSTMGAGDTLYLRGGIYNERILRDNGPIPVGTSWSDAPLIVGYPGERVVMTQGIGLYGSDEKYIKFDNFVFDTAYNSGDTILISIGAGYMRFTNFELMHSNGSGGVQLPETGAGYNEFINCKVHDNGVRSRYDHGFYISLNNNLVENCDIYNNAVFGVHVYSGTPSNNIHSYPLLTAAGDTLD